MNCAASKYGGCGVIGPSLAMEYAVTLAHSSRHSTLVATMVTLHRRAWHAPGPAAAAPGYRVRRLTADDRAALSLNGNDIEGGIQRGQIIRVRGHDGGAHTTGE